LSNAQEQEAAWLEAVSICTLQARLIFCSSFPKSDRTMFWLKVFGLVLVRCGNFCLVICCPNQKLCNMAVGFHLQILPTCVFNKKDLIVVGVEVVEPSNRYVDPYY
jgi:hypothetical protein